MTSCAPTIRTPAATATGPASRDSSEPDMTTSFGRVGRPQRGPAARSAGDSADEGRQRLPDLDDVRGQHPAGLRTHVAGVVRPARRYQEAVAGVQREGGLPV